MRQASITGPIIYRFAYDDNGSMTGKFNGAGQTLLNVDYDQRRLASVMAVDNIPNSLAFKYDANAYRIEKQNSSGSKKYYLEAEHLESVYDENNQLQANYLRGAVVDEIISAFERNASSGLMENRTVHHDQVNSVVALSDHNGQTVQNHSYGPFGEALASTGTSPNTMKYTGREQDAESGLYYYRARYYDPELGRFISEDPIAFQGGINFYAYVGNNPLSSNDPMGLKGTSIGTYDVNDPDYHYYKTESKICSGGPYCTMDRVNDASFNNPAPGVSFFYGEVETGDTTFVILDPLPVPAGFVTHSINLDENYVENLTVSYAHTLDSGVVRRTTEQRSDGIYIVTEGEGVGFFGDFNVATAPLYWDTVHDGQIRADVTPSLFELSLDSTKDWNDVYQNFNGTDAGSAAGGYVLYPRKVNNNMLIQVYAK